MNKNNLLIEQLERGYSQLTKDHFCLDIKIKAT